MEIKGAAPGLTAREREIAIAAIGGRVTGTTIEAAKQLLAGIAALDGEHLPILIWPESISRSERAAWHEREAAYWRESAARWLEVLSLSARSADKEQISDQTGAPTVSADTPPPRSA